VQKSTFRVARKRRLAREMGLCITCCTEQPENGRAVCLRCAKKATLRTAQHRALQREATTLGEIAAFQEHAGDRACGYHLYEDAAEHFQNALNVGAIAQADRSRISEKLAYVLSLGRNPAAASSLFDRALASHIGKPEEASKTVEILLQQARQLWMDMRTQDALPLLEQAIQIAEANGAPRLRKMTNIRMANYLVGLCRHEEAKQFLDVAGDVDDGDDAILRGTYYTQRAIIAGEFGDATAAFDYFERAIDAAQEDSDVFHAASVWGIYSSYANWLGNIELAKACCERSLLIARQFHIMWYIPRACLAYADILFRIGQYGIAYEYLLDALSRDTHVPIIDVALANAGIPLALHMKDETILEKCVRVSALDFAFRSGSIHTICSTVAAFAQWYVACGREREARVLIHRVVETLSSPQQLTDWDFPIAVAQYGSLSDIPRIHGLLRSRADLPCSDVAQACLSLFNAFFEKRNRKHADAYRHAAQAVERFKILGWHRYSSLAQTLLPTPMQEPTFVTSNGRPFADLQTVLTVREQQVAGFVLQGLSNRAIATELSITENTVEKHMTAIMIRLGIRSRHQLAAALESAPNMVNN